ncbi:MAG: hypothetical protein R3D98_01275 [Candidatus Krumholzibacteriia bacterium]
MTLCLAATAALAGPGPEPAPVDTTSLRVGEITLELDGIFTPDEVAEASGPNRFLRRAMNTVHWNTRPWVISKELLFRTGQPYRPALLAESERNLRGLGFLTDIEVVATDTTADGRVNVRVRTRETWTLGAEFSFALAGDGAVRWDASLAEQNFLGYGLEVLGALGDDLDASYGRIYLKLNRVLQTPLSVRLNVDERSDGFDRWVQFALPVRADDQRWSANAMVWDQEYRVRWYLSNGGPAGIDPRRETRLYALLPRRRTGMDLTVTRRVSDDGDARIWRLGLGLRISQLDYMLAGNTYLLSDGRIRDLSYLGTPGETLARDTGTEVWPYLSVVSVGRRWVKTRYLLRYGNDEDVPLDPSFVLLVGPAAPALGSTAGRSLRAIVEGEFRNWSQVGRSFFMQRLDGRAVIGDRNDRYHRLDAVLGSHVRLGPQVRPFTLKAYLEGVHSEGLAGDQVPVLGLDRGLRTLNLDGMAGEKLVRWSVELGRGLGWSPLDLVRMGWGVFYGGGMARWADEDRGLADARHEVGVGLRLGFTRAGNSPVARIDLARDLSGANGWVLTTVTGGFF